MKYFAIAALVIFFTDLRAEIYKCLDGNGGVKFSDKIECNNPDQVNIIENNSKTGKKFPEKITLSNVDELRKSPYAVKLSFDKKWKYAVTGYYEGFYIVYPDHVSIFIDKALITRTTYGDLDDVNLESIQFALFTNDEFGSEKQNWVYSRVYKIKHNLEKSESIVYQNIEFTIWTVGYSDNDLRKYKVMGIVGFDKKYTVPILSNEFIKIENYQPKHK